MSNYWSAIPASAIAGLAEAAIAHSATVLREAMKREISCDPMKAYSYSVIETFANMEALIPAVPASDILRAEQIAFRLRDLAKVIGDEDLVSRADAVMAAVRDRRAYKTLVNSKHARDRYALAHD